MLAKLRTRMDGLDSEHQWTLPGRDLWEAAAMDGVAANAVFANGKNQLAVSDANFNFAIADAFLDKTGLSTQTPANKPMPVDSFPATGRLGLQGVSGNVDEWCSDLYFDVESGDSMRVCKGGNYRDSAMNCRPALIKYDQKDRSSGVGIRLVRPATAEESAAARAAP
jgi:formylglycine-generating enzyme required for sulfatase activity